MLVEAGPFPLCSIRYAAMLMFVLLGLGAGLAVGAFTEVAKRGLGLAGLSDASRSSFLCDILN